MTLELTPEQNANLGKLGDLAGSIDGKLAVAEARSRHRSILLLLAIGLALVIGVSGVLYAWSAHGSADSARKEARRAAAALVAYKADTQKARVASCQQYNVQQQHSIAASDVHDQIEANAISPPPRSAGDEAAVEKALGAEHNAALLSFKLRDCSAAGIAAYLNQGGR